MVMHASEKAGLYRSDESSPDSLSEDEEIDSAPTSFSGHVDESQAGQRLDAWIAAACPQYSRTHWRRLIERGLVRVDGRAGSAKTGVFEGQQIEAELEPPVSDTPFLPESIAIDVVFEDAEIAVIAKPAGLVVHPGAGNWSGTLLNGLLARYPASKELPRAGIVHRLDKETSGLLVVAKTLNAQRELVLQMQAKTAKRVYLALAIGRMMHKGRVDAPITRDSRNRLKMAIGVEGGSAKPAATRYRPLAYGAIDGQAVSLVRLDLETGRTHQIRVHLASLGFPLIGDALYGGAKVTRQGFTRQALHAKRLGLTHPSTGEFVSWDMEPPPDFLALLESAKLLMPSNFDEEADEDDPS
jgi:23S rRNA pseudouridine1911/1915/1917 synthase